MESYQELSYRLDPDARQLKLSWGVEDPDRTVVESMEAPPIPSEASCNGTLVVCMTHDWADSEVPLPGF